MKFAEKYELLESLTTGAVETFVANDKVRGQRVLVHIVHCDPQKPNQPTVQWVLEAFRRVAPDPVGLVLETGPYSGTLYAYLVTKLPEEGTLRAWVKQYEARPRDTQEIPAPVPPRAPQSESRVADAAPKPTSPGPGPVTQLLRSFELPPKPMQTEPHAQPLPNLGPAADRSPVRTAPVPAAPIPAASGWEPVAPQAPVPTSAELAGGGAANSPRPNLPAKSFPSGIITPPSRSSSTPGEFTSAFQGPFHGDRPSDMPAVTDQKMEPPRKTVGDFTAMFDMSKAQPQESSPARGVAGNENAGTGFTGYFTPEPSRTPTSTAPTPPIFPAPQTFPAPPVFPAPQAFPAPQPFPTPTPLPPNPPLPQSPVVGPSSRPSDGATHAFSAPVSEPAPSPPPMPSGPSAYTQIISVKAANPAGDEAGMDEEMLPAKSPAAPAFPAASLPKLPKAPPLPPAPKMPKIAMPPGVPKPPKVDIAPLAPPPVSYWPLILTLTVLFFVAVLLVLYLVLKH